ncbi:ATP-binding protein, partial [Bacillus cereus]
NLQRILEDFKFGAQLLSKFDETKALDRQLILYFSSLYSMKDRDYQQKVGSTLNKLRKITLSETLNSLFSAHTNGIKWRTGMDEGYFTIFDLSGLTSFEKQLIGSLCLTFSQLAAMSREDSHRSGEYMPLHPIVVDEAPTFMEQSADAIQSFADEARKYNVPVVLGMQGLEGQVPDDVASAIFRNFGFMIAYRVGNEVDRQNIYRNLQVDYLSADDFKEIEPNFAYMRMAVGRETTRPFLVHMKAPTKPYEGDVAPIIESLLTRVLEEEKAVKEENEALERKEKEEEPDVFDSKESAEPEKVEKSKVNLDKANDEVKEEVEIPEQEEVKVKDNTEVPIVAAETVNIEEEEEVDVFG